MNINKIFRKALINEITRTLHTPDWGDSFDDEESDPFDNVEPEQEVTNSRASETPTNNRVSTQSRSRRPSVRASSLPVGNKYVNTPVFSEAVHGGVETFRATRDDGLQPTLNMLKRCLDAGVTYFVYAGPNGNVEKVGTRNAEYLQSIGETVESNRRNRIFFYDLMEHRWDAFRSTSLDCILPAPSSCILESPEYPNNNANGATADTTTTNAIEDRNNRTTQVQNTPFEDYEEEDDEESEYGYRTGPLNYEISDYNNRFFNDNIDNRDLIIHFTVRFRICGGADSDIAHYWTQNDGNFSSLRDACDYIIEEVADEPSWAITDIFVDNVEIPETRTTTTTRREPEQTQTTVAQQQADTTPAQTNPTPQRGNQGHAERVVEMFNRMTFDRFPSDNFIDADADTLKETMNQGLVAFTYEKVDRRTGERTLREMVGTRCQEYLNAVLPPREEGATPRRQFNTNNIFFYETQEQSWKQIKPENILQMCANWIPAELV